MNSVSESAHSLKSVAALIGAKLVTELARDIEVACKHDDLKRTNLCMTQMNDAFVKTQKAMVTSNNPEMGESVVLF